LKKILIIEDDPLVTRIYRQKYEAAGYGVASAEDGEKGLQKVKDLRPDLVHLDLMLPKMSGVAVIRKIRSHPEFKTMPILVLSNTYATDLIGEAEQAGANRCISKVKSSPKLVLDVVSELLYPPQPSSIDALQSSPVASGPLGKSTPPAPPLLEATKKISFPGELDGDRSQPNAREEFLKSAPRMQADLCSRMSLFIKGRDEKDHLSHLRELTRSIHSMAGYAGMTGFIRISHIANVLEVLLKELHNKPQQITPSTFRTVANAVDCLGLLFKEVSSPQEEFFETALILAVDDEPISRIALRAAMEKANLRAITLDDPVLALKVLAQNRFDLIFLDVDMPGMDGFELCAKIRASVTNKMTPVVFVTALSDFENRTRSTLSGGNDLIAKPFLQSELAVKALTLIVKAVVAAKNVTSSPTSKGGDAPPERHET
jgi:CheY-like chemotaxis protein